MTWIANAAVERLRDVADFPVPCGDRYAIEEAIGHGGMGTVYRAHDRELDRPVALKVLSAISSSADLAARLRQEARILASLDHPGVVPVYDVGVLDDGRIFYAMKLVQGLRLDQHAASRPLIERLRLFTRICEPVAFAHAHGIVHRDLKPENVMIGAFGEVLVMDWGVAVGGRQSAVSVGGRQSAVSVGGRQSAVSVEDRQSAVGDAAVIAGTRGYMSPEQERGEAVDARADIYALGGLLQFLLIGAAPDAASSAGPRALQAVCRKARAANPADRYSDVAALSNDVDRFLAGEPVSALAEGVLERVSRFARRNRAAIVIVVTYLTFRYLIAWLAP